DAIYGTGAWDASTGRRIVDFNGSFNTMRGAGAWALFVDSSGALWQGGDYSYSTRPGHIRQWSGGFVRHAQVDVTAPTAPADLRVLHSQDGVTLSWSEATDDTRVTAYQVLRHDRVAATVSGTSVTLPAVNGDPLYFV